MHNETMGCDKCGAHAAILSDGCSWICPCGDTKLTYGWNQTRQVHNERDAGDVVFGYADAFYEIASMVGIGAQLHSPQEVWERQLRPTIALLIATRPPAPEDAGTVERVSMEVLVFGGRADQRYRKAYDALVRFNPSAVHGKPVLDALSEIVAALSRLDGEKGAK